MSGYINGFKLTKVSERFLAIGTPIIVGSPEGSGSEIKTIADRKDYISYGNKRSLLTFAEGGDAIVEPTA